MKKNLILFLLAILSAACNKNDSTPQSDIVGYVKLYDVVGTPLDDNSGILISAEIDGNILSTNSDKAGKFTFGGLETGTYNITYSGTNFPTIKKYGIAHTGIGNNFIGSINISTKPDFKMGTFQVTSAGGYKFSGTYTKNETRNITVFFGKTSTVNKDNAIYSQTITGNAGQLPNTLNYSNSNLTNRGFNIGETIYAIAYPSTSYTNTFVELETGKLIFPALGEPSNFHSFVLQ